MPATFRSDASGLFSALQHNGIDRLILRDNGALEAVAHPATGNRSLALATMQKFADEFTASIVASGWQRLASGLIIQWGTSNGNNPAATLSFPIAFPNAALQIVASVQGGGAGTNVQSVGVNIISASQFSLLTMDTSGGSFSKTVRWIAIGH